MPTTYAIPNGRTVMDATLYTGTGAGGLTVTNNDLGSNGFYPDLIWIKSRNAAYYNTLLDYPRGASVRLFSNLTDAESNNGCQSSFNSNGFTLNADAGGVNNSGTTYVAWQWNAGSGTTSTNTNGSITSTVDVNPTAGFSIVQYTGTGATGGTIGHGLGVAPSFVVVKNRTVSGYSWVCYHSALGSNQYFYLDRTDAADTISNVWGSGPTSTTFGVWANAVAGNNQPNPYIAYCWSQVAGFSQFGKYTGNGSANGPFVYTGFRPRFIIIKRTDSAGYSWFLFDSARNTYNATNLDLYANSSSAESPDNALDFLSNGFRPVDANTGTNGSGGTFIYLAFAENPFKYANAR